jgi:phenylalanyl-tRNA synthetase beta chain
MKIQLSWLREFVDVPGTPEAIAAMMSLRGFAAESIEPLGAEDAVIDFEVTANRPDCMSVLGMAREVATAYELPLQLYGQAGHVAALRAAQANENRRTDEIAVTIESPTLGPRYVGATADVTVGPSPEWMQSRLRAAGVRPISNVVDISNYVLLELGQPMHAFDLARLEGREIRVRTAHRGESLTTLDGQTRALDPDVLVIADAVRSVAVAGVMGGADSEVGDTTSAIVFESAYFNPSSVRRTSRALGLTTEASMRFERGADPSAQASAMARACGLLEQIGAGRARGTVVDCYPAPIVPRSIRLRRARMATFLGVSVPDADVARLLTALGFTATAVPDGWDVAIPTRRVDVLREVDLIEDVARHYGFDRIPVTFPALAVAPPPIDPRVTRARQLRSVMTGAGFFEAVTFGFIPAPLAATCADASEIVPIANPLSETFAVLRPSALPGLLAAVAHNRRRQQPDVRLFEIGAAFARSTGEHRMLACAWTGSASAEHWSHPGTDAVDFFDVKDTVERVCRAMRVDAQVEPHADTRLVAGRSAAVTAGGVRIGVLGLASPALTSAHELTDAEVYVAEIDLDLAEIAARTGDPYVEALPRYPSVTRDLSVVVRDSLQAAAIRRTALDAASSTLASVREFDRYQGTGIPDGHVSLSIRLTFRALDRTLTDAEVQAATSAVLQALQHAHGAVQR